MGEASKYAALSTQTSWAQSLALWVGMFNGVGPFPTAKSEVDVYARIKNLGGATVVAGGVGRIVQYDCFDWQRGGKPIGSVGCY